MVKKTSTKSISFVTKSGKEVTFKPTGSRSKARSTHVKQLEKRLSAMEKAVMQYNNAVQNHQAKRKAGGESDECKDGKGVVKADKPIKSQASIKTVIKRQA